MEFDRILATAQASLAEHPLRAELSDREIEQIAKYQSKLVLGEDEDKRTDGVSVKEYEWLRGVFRDLPPLPPFTGLSEIAMRTLGQRISGR